MPRRLSEWLPVLRRAPHHLLPPRPLRTVDPSSLVFFRIAFGAIMLWEVWRFIDHDWVGRYFSGKDFYFKIWPFDFVAPWPGVGMDIHVYVMALVAAFIIVGLRYRVAAVMFFLMVSYVFLLEEARYLNHLYLVCLISFVMVFLPAHRLFSLDSLLRPQIHRDRIPQWPVWILRFQVGVPYFFGGVAKLNGDWLRGEPMRAWLADRTDFPLIGEFFTQEPVVWAVTYGAMLMDLLVVFFLLHPRTRVFAYIAVLVFHFANSSLFDIGIFPWFMILCTTIFFEPDWPRRVIRDLRTRHRYRFPALVGGFTLGFFVGGFLPESFSFVRALMGGVGVSVAAYHLDEPFRVSGEERQPAGPAAPYFAQPHRWVLALLGAWIAFQVLVPLRHFVIPGNVSWTEEGHNYSWHMKLRDKDAAGYFVVIDSASGESWAVLPRQYLTSRQASKMVSRPHMAVEFAHFLEREAQDRGLHEVEIRAVIQASLNGREPQLLIDPEKDLTMVSQPWFGHADWILPLEVPLNP